MTKNELETMRDVCQLRYSCVNKKGEQDCKYFDKCKDLKIVPGNLYDAEIKAIAEKEQAIMKIIIGKLNACGWIKGCLFAEDYCNECGAEKTELLTAEQAKEWWIKKIEERMIHKQSACDWIDDCTLDMDCNLCGALHTTPMSVDEAQVWWKNRLKEYNNEN